MKFLFLFVFLFSFSALGQYFPRGININDGYLPNLDEPDKWMISLDGMFDWQKEDQTGAQQVSYQTTHANFNAFYGGQNFRGGAQVIHDFNRQVKDLSIGFGLAFNRPLFVELGAGYLSRVRDNSSTEGWSYSVKVGYYFNWVMDIKYRIRMRISMMYNHKHVNDTGDPKVTNFYPFIGFEFET